MPKLKTKRGVRRRFKISGTGKVLSFCSGTIHFMRRKRANRKRRLGQMRVLGYCNAKRVWKMLPYA